MKDGSNNHFIHVYLFPPLFSVFYYFSFPDEEPGEEEGKKIHSSGKKNLGKLSVNKKANMGNLGFSRIL